MQLTGRAARHGVLTEEVLVDPEQMQETTTVRPSVLLAVEGLDRPYLGTCGLKLTALVVQDSKPTAASIVGLSLDMGSCCKESISMASSMLLLLTVQPALQCT